MISVNMDYCDIKITQKGQTLKDMSGLPELHVYSFINGFSETYGRFPELDEIPHANSEEHLNKQLDIKSTKTSKYTTTKKLLEVTGTDNVNEANIKLNQEHSDLEIQLNQIGDAVIVKVEHRPTEYVEEEISPKSIDFDKTRESNSLILREALNRLQKYYGVQTIAITNSELPEGFAEAQAFIKDGNIYINTDKATIDSPIHEQLHLFMGSIRFSNPSLYYSLVQSTEQLPNFNLLAKEFPNRTMSDIQEEIFVNETAKYITKQPSLLDSIDNSIVNNLLYYITRDIDSILMGKQSVKALSSIFDKSLLQLAEETDSDNFDIDTAGTLDDATIHRIMANTKEQLLSNNELIQDCV